MMKYPLSCYGVLVVTEKQWYIEFKIKEEDTRYRKKALRISEKELEEYCSNLRENFVEYENMKQKGIMIPKQGKGGMWIRFGFREGVCLFEQSYPIRDRNKLNQILEELEGIKSQVEKLR